MELIANNFGNLEMSLEEAARLLQEMAEPAAVLSEKEVLAREEMLAKQERDKLLANKINSKLSILHNGLKEAKTAGEMRAYLYAFYDDLLLIIKDELFGPVLQYSDAMLLLIGIYHEYMNALDESIDVTRDEKLKRLNALLHNFSVACQHVNMTGTWDTVEQSISTLIDITGVEENEMAELNLRAELTDENDLEKIHENANLLEKLDNKPIKGTLQKFAENKIDLAEMARLASIWQEVKAKITAVMKNLAEAADYKWS